jgi:hypothetical protein
MICSYNDIKTKYDEKYEKEFDRILWESLKECRERK